MRFVTTPRCERCSPAWKLQLTARDQSPINTGFGEAVTAVNNAAHYISPHMKVFPGYSTTIMKQRERKKRKE